MRVKDRGLNWIDYTDLPGGGSQRRRQLRNGANYRTPAGLLIPSSPSLTEDGAPGYSGGLGVFSHSSSHGQIQFFCRDSTDTGNRAMVGIQLSNKPGARVTWKAHNVNPGVEPVITGSIATYSDLWDGVTWRLNHLGNKLKDEVVIADADTYRSENGNEAVFSWTLQTASGYTIAPTSDGFHLTEIATGETQGVMRMPIAWDSIGSALKPNIECGLRVGPVVNGRPTVELWADISSAVGEVVIDPTTTVNGATDIDDMGMVRSGGLYSFFNYGGWQYGIMAGEASDIYYRSLLRISTSAIPEGSYSAFRFYGSVSLVSGAPVASIYRVSEANAAWVEGTATGSIQVGSACWDYIETLSAVPTGTPWNGSVGLGTPIDDYDVATAVSAVSLPTSTGWAAALSLNTSWLTDWKSGAWANGGMFWKDDTDDGWGGFRPNRYTIYDSNETANPPYIEIDWEEVSDASFFFMAF